MRDRFVVIVAVALLVDPASHDAPRHRHGIKSGLHSQPSRSRIQHSTFRIDRINALALALRQFTVSVWINAHFFLFNRHGVKPGFCAQAAAIPAEGYAFGVRAVNTVLLAVKVLLLCVVLNGSDPHRLPQNVIWDALVGVRRHAGAFFLRCVVEITEIKMVPPVLGFAHHIIHFFFGQRLNGNRFRRTIPLVSGNHVVRRCSSGRRQERITLFTPADAAFQNVAQEDLTVHRLLHRHLAVCAVRVQATHPIQALAVLCAHQGAVNQDRLHA